jgi:hypothetical protein
MFCVNTSLIVDRSRRRIPTRNIAFKRCILILPNFLVTNLVDIFMFPPPLQPLASAQSSGSSGMTSLLWMLVQAYNGDET